MAMINITMADSFMLLKLKKFKFQGNYTHHSTEQWCLQGPYWAFWYHVTGCPPHTPPSFQLQSAYPIRSCILHQSRHHFPFKNQKLSWSWWEKIFAMVPLQQQLQIWANLWIFCLQHTGVLASNFAIKQKNRIVLQFYFLICVKHITCYILGPKIC